MRIAQLIHNTNKLYTLMGRRDLRQQICLKGQVEQKTTRFQVHSPQTITAHPSYVGGCTVT